MKETPEIRQLFKTKLGIGEIQIEIFSIAHQEEKYYEVFIGENHHSIHYRMLF